MRGRIAGMLQRSAATTDGRDDAGELSSASASSVAPPDDFKFPWTRSDERGFDSVDTALPTGSPFSPGADRAAPRIDETEPSRSTALARLDVPAALTEQKTDEFVAVDTAPGAESGSAEGGALAVSQAPRLARLLRLGKQRKAPVAEAAATVVEGNPAFLFAKFRAFYKEIIRARHQKTELASGFSTAILAEHSAETSPDTIADALSKRLIDLLELQAAEAKWMGGEAGDWYPDAQYAMAALADETFMHCDDWEGQSAWPQHLLEVKLFKTHSAEVELFRRIDKLLKEQPNTPVARDLGRVYLLVLAAGFRGKYRPFGLTRVLAEYRQRLFEYVHGSDPLQLYAPDRSIFPDATAHTLIGQAVSRFTAAQRWTAILAFLVVAYGIAAHLAWSGLSEDLEDVTGRIRASSGAEAR